MWKSHTLHSLTHTSLTCAAPSIASPRTPQRERRRGWRKKGTEKKEGKRGTESVHRVEMREREIDRTVKGKRGRK